MQGRKNGGIVKRERCMSNDSTGEIEERLSELPEIYPRPRACASNYSSGVLQVKFRKQ
jgi:hypothetical protein